MAKQGELKQFKAAAKQLTTNNKQQPFKPELLGAISEASPPRPVLRWGLRGLAMQMDGWSPKQEERQRGALMDESGQEP